MLRCLYPPFPATDPFAETGPRCALDIVRLLCSRELLLRPNLLLWYVAPSELFPAGNRNAGGPKTPGILSE